VDDFEIIELNSNNATARSGIVEGCGQSGQDPEEPLTRGAVTRQRWRSAIHQQIVLIRMDRQNHWIKGQLRVTEVRSGSQKSDWATEVSSGVMKVLNKGSSKPQISLKVRLLEQ